MRALLAVLLLALSFAASACDSTAPHPPDRCPAPWLPDQCPPEDRVPW